MIGRQKFPKDFLWGASTASHQVEGGTVNQWSRWELEQASQLAASAEERLSWLPDWQDIKAQATNPENYVSGTGVDHYSRYEEDFDLLQKLQFNSFRFGIEWSRIEPEEGAFNLEEIKHYHDYVDALLERGITPMMNIWHWTMPTWFTDKGGFAKKENLPLFDAYVQKIADEFADKVQYIITLNEPNVYASFSYLNGEHPPQEKSVKIFFHVYRNLMQAHKRAYKILKARRSTLQIGAAAQLGNIQAKRPHNVFDGVVTKFMRWFWNWWFLNSIRRYQDFVGINYYFTDYYRGLSFGSRHQEVKQGNEVHIPGLKRVNPGVPLNDIGLYMEPEGLYPVMLRVWARYKKPIIITENGVADRNDDYREWWLEQTVLAMQRAMSEGVEIKGYMHWSLLDNFEWAFGWWPKFGLVEVDRENGMQRKPRPSAIWFARLLRELRGETPPQSKAQPPVKLMRPSQPEPAETTVPKPSRTVPVKPSTRAHPPVLQRLKSRRPRGGVGA